MICTKSNLQKGLNKGQGSAKVLSKIGVSKVPSCSFFAQHMVLEVIIEKDVNTFVSKKDR